MVKKIDFFSLKAGNIFSLFTILSISWKETEIELTELNSVDIKAGLKLKNKSHGCIQGKHIGGDYIPFLPYIHILFTQIGK